MDGGKLSTGEIQKLLNQSYDSKKPKNVGDFIVDKSLSGERVQVYQNKKTGQVVVAHRGTQGIHDIGNDLKYAVGMDLSNTARVKHAKEIQKKAEAKYGAENITTIGHSLGSKIAREVGKKTKEVIQLNPAYNIPDSKKKASSKEYTIRTEYDPVSFLKPMDSNTTTIKSETKNPLKEHTVDAIGRISSEKQIGRGMSLRQLKSIAKGLPKEQRIPLTKIKKKDLYDHLEKMTGGADYDQIGTSAQMRTYFGKTSDARKMLNAVTHSADADGSKYPSPFYNVGMDEDPNVDMVIAHFYETYLYNWYKKWGEKGIENPNGESKYWTYNETTEKYEPTQLISKKGNKYPMVVGPEAKKGSDSYNDIFGFTPPDNSYGDDEPKDFTDPAKRITLRQALALKKGPPK